MNKKPVYKSDVSRKRIIEYYDRILHNWSVPYLDKYIDTVYGRTYLIEAGRNDLPPVFLFHGSCSNSLMWLNDIQKLINEYHVFAVDILGEAGKSSENRPELRSDEYAEWIKEILNILEIDKAIFIGNSYGGWMALKFASTYPRMVSKLVLLATSGISPVKMSFIIKSIAFTIRGEKGLKSLNKMVYANNNIPDAAIEASSLIIKNFNPRIGALPNYTDEQLKRLNMPVLYIGGENDATVNTRRTAQKIECLIPEAVTKILKNRGHVIYDVMDTVMEFLKDR